MLKIATKFIPKPENFTRAWSAGFRFAEFWLSAELLNDADQIVETAKDYPFGYVPHFPNRKVNEQGVKQAIRLYRELNSQALVIHQPMFDTWQKEFLSRDPKIRLAVENHRLDEKSFWQWAEKNPGLNLDVEHLWKFTLQDSPLAHLLKTLEKFLGRYAAKLYHVHLPGYTPGAEEHRPMYCNRNFVFGVWGLLEEFGYEGLVVSEVDKEYQTDQDLQMDMLLFERWWSNKKIRSGRSGLQN